jgi:hypothetical protein
MRLISLVAASLLACAGLAGCGGAGPEAGKAPDMGGPDANAVCVLVEDANDLGTNAKKYDAAFVKGSKPADLKKFAQHSYGIVGRPKVEGASATCTVRVTKTATSEAIGEKEWVFAKEGDKWKIKDAPLP